MSVTVILQWQWCRRRGAGGWKRIPKSSDLVKIRAKSMEIWAKSVKTFAKSLRILAKSLKIWAKSKKIRAKMAPNVLWFEKMAPIASSEIRSSWENIRTKNGQNFFRAKILRTPKICLLLTHIFSEAWGTTPRYLQTSSLRYLNQRQKLHEDSCMRLHVLYRTSTMR